mmetsp:Transcript_52863/g.140572  ORF Transcript_52863/g.140572 Transcript_52863/m.140572 type:complete len:225 (-) Transcript_52863:346-1020(-)
MGWSCELQRILRATVHPSTFCCKLIGVCVSLLPCLPCNRVHSDNLDRLLHRHVERTNGAISCINSPAHHQNLCIARLPRVSQHIQKSVEMHHSQSNNQQAKVGSHTRAQSTCQGGECRHKKIDRVHARTSPHCCLNRKRRRHGGTCSGHIAGNPQCQRSRNDHRSNAPPGSPDTACVSFSNISIRMLQHRYSSEQESDRPNCWQRRLQQAEATRPPHESQCKRN